MTRNNDGKNGRALPRLAAAALGALMISCLGLMAAPTAFAEEVNDLPGTYQLPLKASEAVSRIAEAPSYAAEAATPDASAADAPASSAPEGASVSDAVSADAPSAGSTASAKGAEDDAPATPASDESVATNGADDPAAASSESEAPSPTSPATEEASAGASSDQGTAPSATAQVAQGAGKARAAGEARAAQTAAAAAKATPTAVTPATFTISGMKFLEGRALEAGEFTFKLAPAGAARVSARSDLPRKLRPPSTLTDAEKYELVAHGDLVYYPSALQPMPASDTTQNNADGQVSFGPLTFDLSCLGETSTQRHQGTVFCYTVAEEPPRNADGTLADGVTKDERGRCVYQGVTYDDSVKRIYIYAYETGDDSGNPEIEIIPLGDATFDAHPAKAGAGLGAGFLNVFNGAVLESYDGAVYLADEPITAGEFNFEVREVAEDGTILDDLSVPCEAAENGSEGAGVRLITDEVYGEPGRFFYTVRQTASARTGDSDIVLDESSYVITVEVTQGADSDDLQAAITYVRKKPAGSDQWVDVALDTQPSPVTWENRVKSPDEPDNPDNPDSPGESGSGSGSATTPGGDTGAATSPDEPGDDAGGTTKPDAGQNPDATEPDDGAHADNPTGASKPEGGTSAESGSSQGGSDASSSAADKGTDASSDDSASAAAASGAASGSATAKSSAKTSGAFAQTGDDLGVPMLIAFLIVVASGVVLAIVSRRRTPRS